MPRFIVLCLIFLNGLTLTGCTNVFFMPMQQQVRTPVDIGLEYQDVYFSSTDDTQLHGWFLPAQAPAKGSILFLHGNAENISTHIGSVHWLPKAGYNVLLFDYRGYGNSAGTAHIDGVVQDAIAAIKKITRMKTSRDLPVIVYGQSIGGAIATYAVAHSPDRERINALIVESAFSSYRLIAREKLAAFWLTWPLQYPLSWTISDTYKPLDAVTSIAPIPLLLIYSEEDRIIPTHQGEQLFAAAKQPKQFWLFPNGHHISIFSQANNQQRLLDYLDALSQQ